MEDFFRVIEEYEQWARVTGLHLPSFSSGGPHQNGPEPVQRTVSSGGAQLILHHPTDLEERNLLILKRLARRLPPGGHKFEGKDGVTTYRASQTECSDSFISTVKVRYNFNICV